MGSCSLAICIQQASLPISAITGVCNITFKASVLYRHTAQYLVSSKSVKFSHTVTQRSVTIHHPNFTVRATQLSTKSETSTNTQSSKCARIKPTQRATRSEDVGGGSYKVTSICNQDGVVWEDVLKGVEDLDGVQVLVGGLKSHLSVMKGKAVLLLFMMEALRPKIE
jgi:hypothetical protein